MRPTPVINRLPIPKSWPEFHKATSSQASVSEVRHIGSQIPGHQVEVPALMFSKYSRKVSP